MLRTFIQVFALAMGILASGFWIRSVVSMRAHAITGLSRTMWDHSLAVAKNLCDQRADALVAVVLLSISTLFQMVNLLWPMRICDFAVNKRGAAIAFLISILVLVAAIFISNKLSISQYNQVKAELDRDLHPRQPKQ